MKHCIRPCPIIQAGKGGDLTHDETTIIAGALELTEKTAKDAMTPISNAFSLDLDATLNLWVCGFQFIFCQLCVIVFLMTSVSLFIRYRETLNAIMTNGHKENDYT